METILIEPRDGTVVSCLTDLLQTSADEVLADGDAFKVGLSGDMSRPNLIYRFRKHRYFDQLPVRYISALWPGRVRFKRKLAALCS